MTTSHHYLWNIGPSAGLAGAIPLDEMAYKWSQGFPEVEGQGEREVRSLNVKECGREPSSK